MNIRLKAQLFTVMLFLLVALFAAATVMFGGLLSVGFGALTFALLFPANFYFRQTFKCPNCGTPLFERGGFKILAAPPLVCGRCDTDLTGQ